MAVGSRSGHRSRPCEGSTPSGPGGIQEVDGHRKGAGIASIRGLRPVKCPIDPGRYRVSLATRERLRTAGAGALASRTLARRAGRRAAGGPDLLRGDDDALVAEATLAAHGLRRPLGWWASGSYGHG